MGTTPARKQSKKGDQGSPLATVLCVAGLVGGFVWYRWRSSTQEGRHDDKSNSEDTSLSSVDRSSQRSSGTKCAGNRKKRSRSAKAEEKQRRAEKREKHLKETRGPEKQQEDDGNNVLYANSTYYVGGRAEQANAAFGGNAIISSKNH
eukprot:CAMPEP_0117672556 /NCGR_PEP_ID=MMETSP0804-20121206/13970_1 /TAXON_ID=1074897 /ORGANISM="Tetraselmis astigmatica, Strain CCMP880" /LENGTH=147 /DNA_ID=CAMNT_0005481171 /DNA_START=35 /DNA_END=478 /DNA_ORIENTATION=+